jgi:hypothetical protein
VGMSDAPLELTMRLRNNALKRRRVDLNLSIDALCEQLRICKTTYCALETLRLGPLCKRKFGEPGLVWRKIALRLSEFYRCMPEDLFPDVVLNVSCPVVVKELEASEVCALLGEQCMGVVQSLPAAQPDEATFDAERALLVEESLRALTPREKRVLTLRFGLDGGEPQTLAQIGSADGVCAERIRNVESRALRKLQHPSLSKRLRGLAT